MNKINYGGQAFPSASGGGDFGLRPVSGMTLRDYFAGQALAGAAGDMKWSCGLDWNVSDLRDMASVFYKVADAMLAVREVKE